MSYFGFEVLTAVARKSYIFCDIMPCNLLKVNQHFGRTHLLLPQGCIVRQAKYQQEAGSSCLLILVSCSAYFLTLSICSSGIMVGFHRITWRYIPKDRILNNNVILK
jgi:hypothetical protein